ncbi:MAG: hypothetical protein U1F43_33825 [Myxococcota bacterium]
MAERDSDDPSPAAARVGLGPKTAAELAALGIDSVAAVRRLGWEEVCRRWVEACPERLNLNAFYGVLAVHDGVDWRDLPPERRADAAALKRRLALELGLAARPHAEDGPARRSRRARGR